MLKIGFIALLLASCATTNSSQNKEMVSTDTAIQLSRTGYIRSCIQAHKYHQPEEKWGKLCHKEAENYIEEILKMLAN